jgi:hypothetical protein
MTARMDIESLTPELIASWTRQQLPMLSFELPASKYIEWSRPTYLNETKRIVKISLENGVAHILQHRHCFHYSIDLSCVNARLYSCWN